MSNTPENKPGSGLPSARKKDRIDSLAASSASTAVVDESGALDDAKGVSLIQGAWLRLRTNWVFLIGLAIVVVFVLLAIIAPWIAPHDPTARMPELQEQITTNTPIPPAEGSYLMGGDNYGRDFFSRLLVGSRQTLIVGVMATLIGLAGGMILGTIAGALGGVADALVMRVVDVMLSVPSLLLAFSIASLAPSGQGSQWTVIIAIAVAQIPIFARLLRGTMIAQRHSDHVLAARALGVKRGPIVFRHMLPNAMAPVIVQATLVLATAIIDAAALSFLGLGNPDTSNPEWGQMLGEEARPFFDNFPHLAIYPAACIVVVALGFTLMGESLREALDPKSRK